MNQRHHDDDALAAMHTPEAIAERIAATGQHSYLGNFVLGAVDGAVTTFAVGVIRGRVSERNPLWTGLETLLIGGAAALLAYLVGVVLKGYAAG